MSKFLESFYEYNMAELVDKINEYAKENNLEIISLSATDNLHGAIVLFKDKADCVRRKERREIR